VGDSEADNFVRREADQAAAVEGDRAARGPQQAGDRAQGGRLAGAVGTDERDDLPGLDVQVDPVQRLDGAVGDVEVAHL